MLDFSSFLVGVGVGILICIVFYFLIATYLGLRRRIQAAYKPQVIAHNTAKTPAQMVHEADSARIKLIAFIAIIVLVGLTAILEAMWPDVLATLMNYLLGR